MTRITTIASILIGMTVAVGCESTHTASHADEHLLASLTRAVTVLTPTDGSETHGVVTFVQTGDAVTVTADVSGLSPNGTHAWHIHEYGDIRDPKGLATGGHYNPEGHAHGLPELMNRHAGDLGNLEADATGRARKVMAVHNCTIAGAYNPIIGRAIIVHEKHDDGGQPTGNAGGRIAQGVIGVAK